MLYPLMVSTKVSNMSVLKLCSNADMGLSETERQAYGKHYSPSPRQHTESIDTDKYRLH